MYQFKNSFKHNHYRYGYVYDFFNSYIDTQIKTLREQRGWNQLELGERAGMMQPRISVMENVNYSSWSIKILRKLAEAFDLTLCVSFESFGTRVNDIEKFSREYLEKFSFKDNPYFKENKENIRSECTEPQQQLLFSNVIYLALHNKNEDIMAKNALSSQQKDQGPENKQSILGAWK